LLIPTDPNDGQISRFPSNFSFSLFNLVSGKFLFIDPNNSISFSTSQGTIFLNFHYGSTILDPSLEYYNYPFLYLQTSSSPTQYVYLNNGQFTASSTKPDDSVPRFVFWSIDPTLVLQGSQSIFLTGLYNDQINALSSETKNGISPSLKVLENSVGNPVSPKIYQDSLPLTGDLKNNIGFQIYFYPIIDNKTITQNDWKRNPKKEAFKTTDHLIIYSPLGNQNGDSTLSVGAIDGQNPWNPRLLPLQSTNQSLAQNDESKWQSVLVSLSEDDDTGALDYRQTGGINYIYQRKYTALQSKTSTQNPDAGPYLTFDSNGPYQPGMTATTQGLLFHPYS